MACVAHRIVVGAANSGRNVVSVDCAIRGEEKTDAVAVLQTAPLEESGQVRRKPVKAGGRSEPALRHHRLGTQFSALQEIPSFGMIQGFGGRVRHGLSRDSVSGFTKGLTRPVEPLPRASPTRLAGGSRGASPCLL